MFGLFGLVLFASCSEIPVTEDGHITKELISQGNGPRVRRGDLVEVNYIGRLSDGRTVDSSQSLDAPFVFTVGSNVIKGLSIAVASMHVGEKAIFKMSHEYCYGPTGYQPLIPPKSAMTFEIEVIKIV
jgi:FKBP-type peptidyl-prolyl cis-trans isomerase